MPPITELQRIELVPDAPTTVPPRDFRPLHVAGSVALRWDSAPANDESPDDAPAASAARTPRDRSSSSPLPPGRMAASDLGAVPQWTSYALNLAAGEHRSRLLAEIATKLARRGARLVRAWHTRLREERRVRVAHAELSRLDERTLRDVGLHRFDMSSVAREARGWKDDATALDRLLLTNYRLPR